MKKVFINRRGQLRSGWKILSIIIIHTILSIILFSFFTTMPLNEDTQEMIGMYGGQITFIITVWIALKWIDKRGFKAIGLTSIRIGTRHFVWGLLFGAVMMTFIFAILLMTDQITLANEFSNPNFSHFLWTGLLLFIIVGFAEEIVFRGYFMKALQQMDQMWLTVLISAFLFSIVHAGNPNASLLGLVNVFIVCILFAYMFIKTGNLWMPIGFHITWNYFQGGVFGFPVSGMDPEGVYIIEKMENVLWTGGSFGPEGGLLTTIFLGIGFLVVWLLPDRLCKKTVIWMKH